MATKKKILIIDDDARNIFALIATLKAKKYECLSVSNAMQGIHLLEKQNDIGIVLIDMMMPEMDGYEAIPIIKQVSASLPVVAVTAQAMTGDRERCLEAGADYYISKPINVDKLLAVITEHVK